jgi:tetratricopeptide (TPR) repeat protein
MSSQATHDVRTERLQALLDGVGEIAEDGQLEQALQLLDEAPDDLKPFGMYHYVRGAILVRLGRLDDAVAALEQGVEAEPEIPELRSNLAAALLEKAQAGGPEGLSAPDAQAALGRALEILDEAAKMQPALAEVHANHGRALHLSGRLPQALIAFERALQLDSTHVPTLYNKAAVLAAQGDDRQVVATLDRLLSIDPDFEPAVLSRERARARLGH